MGMAEVTQEERIQYREKDHRWSCEELHRLQELKPAKELSKRARAVAGPRKGWHRGAATGVWSVVLNATERARR